MIRIPEGDIDVLAIGEILVDFISMEEADTLRDAQTFRKFQGGSPANIAVNVAKLGGISAVIAKTGIGAFGTFLKGELQHAGVITRYMIMDHLVHTSFIFVSQTPGTPDFEASRNGDYKLSPAEVSEEAIEQSRVVHASTFALSRSPLREAVIHTFEKAKTCGKIISFDPNYSQQIWPNHKEAQEILPQVMAFADITKPSLDDCHRFFGSAEKPETYIERFHEMGPQYVVLTMGAEGMLASDGGNIAYIPARDIQVVDATGAGDSFWAGFLVALLDGRSLSECTLFAREIVELKLANLGPLPDQIDRHTIYSKIEKLPR
jgi:fructokinase